LVRHVLEAQFLFVDVCRLQGLHFTSVKKVKDRQLLRGFKNGAVIFILVLHNTKCNHTGILQYEIHIHTPVGNAKYQYMNV